MSVGQMHVLQNADNSISAQFIDYGATLVSLLVPDRHGNIADVLLGCAKPEDHALFHPHFNCIVGRYANRITNATFQIDGEIYQLEANVPPHILHSGNHGIANRLWSSRSVPNGIQFTIHSEDGDAGFPGRVDIVSTYTLVDQTLKLELEATTSRPTPVSLTSHHYYNLSGIQGSSIADHRIQMNADAYCPVSSALTQLGKVEPVEGTPFDLREWTRLGDRITEQDDQIQLAGGFDHNFVINGCGTRVVAKVVEPTSGRVLMVKSNQPGVQLYTSNTLDAKGKNGVRYARHQGFCLETQQFPDAPNHPTYPDAILLPGQRFHAVTEFSFGTE